jgi:uncharacterized protein (DUF2249 family)
LRTLREAAGEPAPVQGEQAEPLEGLPLSAATPAPPAWLDNGRVTARLDARPLHAEGKNPIGPILAAAKKVPEGGILYLRNTFEPLPLYEVLSSQGFAPWARQADGTTDDWEVFFYRARAGEQVHLPGRMAAESAVPPVASVTIDVSQLTPPEPMIRVLGALAQLQINETLLVRHVQRPMYLYAKLDEMGYAHQTWEMGPKHFEILIRVGEKQ